MADITTSTQKALRSQLFFAGKFHDAEAGTFSVTNPCTGEASGLLRKIATIC